MAGEQDVRAVQITDVKNEEWYNYSVGELFEVNGVKLVEWNQLFLFFSTVI
jgi:hypothetical protein